MPALISRTEALQRGLKRYFTGRPCLRGHVAERRVKGRICTVCGALQNAARRAADIERYRRENRERMRRRDKVAKRARDRAAYAANPQKYIAKTQRWQEENRERWLEDRRERRQKRYRDDRIQAVLRGTQIAALRSKVPHTLTYEELCSIWPEKCPILGVEFFSNNAYGTAPRVVRIDRAKGYVKDNVVVLSKDASALQKGVGAVDWAKWLTTLR